jgi:hypothetical protein
MPSTSVLVDGIVIALRRSMAVVAAVLLALAAHASAGSAVFGSD